MCRLEAELWPPARPRRGVCGVEEGVSMEDPGPPVCSFDVSLTLIDHRTSLPGHKYYVFDAHT
jgi:hypothetical protein